LKDVYPGQKKKPRPISSRQIDEFKTVFRIEIPTVLSRFQVDFTLVLRPLEKNVINDIPTTEYAKIKINIGEGFKFIFIF
jgi:hypothetical protein